MKEYQHCYIFYFILIDSTIDYLWVKSIRFDFVNENVEIIYDNDNEPINYKIIARSDKFVIVDNLSDYYVFNIDNSKDELNKFTVFCELFDYKFIGELDSFIELVKIYDQI